MQKILLCLYIINSVLLINFPLIFLILLGVMLFYKNNNLFLLFSVLLSLAGIFAFSLHTTALLKENEKFNNSVSVFIIISTLIVSLPQ